MANDLVIGLVIGATLKGVHSAFADTTKLVNKLGNAVKDATNEQEKLKKLIESSGASKSLGKLHQHYTTLNNAIIKAKNSQDLLNKAIQKQESHTQKRRELQGQLAETSAHAYIGAGIVGAAVRTYIDSENAATNLKIAMMKADGTMGQFDEISKIASNLGKDLPGTTKDFYQLAEALKKQGLSDQVLTGGALKTSAQLNVLLERDQKGGGEFLAKFMESHGLGEKELGKAADHLQRAMFAGGLSKDQMYESMKYYAPKVNALGLTGLENTEKILAIEGMAGQKGLEGSTFGTGLNTMLARMNKGPKMLESASKGMKAEARKMMEESGVTFDFWDKNGAFKGIDAMIQELEKFEVIRQKFGEEGAALVSEELFGMEGGRLADILSQKGKAGLDEMLAKMREQASLQDRINQKTATLGSALESLGGVWDNAVGTIGSAFAEDIKSWANTAQDFIENSLQPFLENNKSLIGFIVKLVGGLMLGKMAFLALSYAANLVLAPIFSLAVGVSKVNAAFRLFQLGKTVSALKMFGLTARQSSMLIKMLSGSAKLFKGFSLAKLNPLKALPAVFGLVKTAIFGVGTALRFLTTSLLTNPIGLAIAGIAVAALLIYHYWNPIKAFFAGVWDGIKAGLAPLMSAFSGLGSYISPVINWFKNLFNITQVGEGNARSLGQTVGGFLANSFMLATIPIRLLWNTLKWLWDSITGLFKGEISIGDIFAGLWAKFEGAIAKITEWKNKAVKLWDDFWSVFKSNKSQSPTAESGAGGSGGGFWSSIANGLETAKNTISQKAGGLWESAKAKFDEAKTSLSEKASGVWQSVTNALNGASNGVSIGAMIGQMVSGVVSAISSAASSIAGVLGTMVQGLSSSLLAIFPVVSTAFAGMASVAATGVAALSAVVTAGFAGLRAIVAAMWQGLGSAMAGNPMLMRLAVAVGQCIGFLQGMSGRFVAIGQHIAAGLARGIESGIGRVRAASVRLAQEVQNATRLQMQIKSPSRVMMAIGRDVVAGLDVGMQKRFVPTLAQYQENVDTLANPVNVDKLKSESFPRLAMLKQSEQNVNGAISVNFNPTIHIASSEMGAKQQAMQGVKMSIHEFEKMLKRVQESQQRRAFV